MKKEDLLKSYRIMKEIREFEERLHVEFATGKIPGFVHLYSGKKRLLPLSVCILPMRTGFPAPTVVMAIA